MAITYVFACLPVANRDGAVAWYERLLARRPDFVPNEAEAVWRLADTASLYVLADVARAGRGMVTLVVDDLPAHLRDLAGRGIAAGAVEDVPGVGRKATVRDPDDNRIQFIEVSGNT